MDEQILDELYPNENREKYKRTMVHRLGVPGETPNDDESTYPDLLPDIYNKIMSFIPEYEHYYDPKKLEAEFKMMRWNQWRALNGLAPEVMTRDIFQRKPEILTTPFRAIKQEYYGRAGSNTDLEPTNFTEESIEKKYKRFLRDPHPGMQIPAIYGPNGNQTWLDSHTYPEVRGRHGMETPDLLNDMYDDRWNDLMKKWLRHHAHPEYSRIFYRQENGDAPPAHLRWQGKWNI